MANFVEVTGDLFKSPYLGRGNTKIMHCISSDYALGAGFALAVENKYHIRDELKHIGSYNYPDCIVVKDIINLVTKGAYWLKPTYQSFELALDMALEFCIEDKVDIVILPRIGCGLDKLDWKICKEMIKSRFIGAGINCVVYKLGRES